MAVSHPNRVAEFTVDQLESFVEEIVSRKLTEHQLLETPTDAAGLDAMLAELDAAQDEVEDGRTVEEVFASIDAHMIHPEPDTPSLVEMLREDRDR
jgi:hypothetical protein